MARIYDNIETQFAEGLQGIITNVGVKRVDFCIGYFNLRGWNLVVEQVDGLTGDYVYENDKRILSKKTMKMWSKIHSFITDSERLDAELNWISKIWYLILVVASSIYVFINFSELVSFTFFEEFNGKNLIFILWLVLLLLPLFDNFEGFGVHFNKHANRVAQKSNEIAEEAMKNAPKTVEDLKKELEETTKEN